MILIKFHFKTYLRMLYGEINNINGKHFIAFISKNVGLSAVHFGRVVNEIF